MVVRYAMNGVRPSEPKPQRPDHEAFGDLVTKYSDAAGSFPGEAGHLVRDAGVLVSQVSGRCRDALGRGAQFARDKTIAPEGRHELIGQLSADVGEDAADKLSRASAMLTMARAELTVDALAKVPRDDRATARQDAAMLLSGVKPEDLSTRMGQLAQREDSIGALVASSWGADYLASRGVDAGQHADVQRHAIAAAADSSDPHRAAAAEALGRLGHMEGALQAAHHQVRHLRDGDLKRVKNSVHNPLAAENARLEQVIESQRHQLHDAQREAQR